MHYEDPPEPDTHEMAYLDGVATGRREAQAELAQALRPHIETLRTFSVGYITRSDPMHSLAIDALRSIDAILDAGLL